MVDRFALGPHSYVVEVASNDGYLLQDFVRRGIPTLGIEPAANIAREAERKGVPTLVRFFGRDTAREVRSEEHTSELQSQSNLVCRLLLEKKKNTKMRFAMRLRDQSRVSEIGQLRWRCLAIVGDGVDG